MIKLTKREREVAEMCSEPSKAIAHKLGIKEVTVKLHLKTAMAKMGASNRTELAIAMMKKRDMVYGNPIDAIKSVIDHNIELKRRATDRKDYGEAIRYDLLAQGATAALESITGAMQ